MERTLEVRTGESIQIRYELAGLGSRFLAVTLDLAIQIGITLLLLVVFVVVSQPAVTAATHVPAWSNVGKTGQAVAGALGVFALFLLYFGYFIIFELVWSGRTPGKRALGIRVMRDAGFPIDIGAAVIRNVVRVLEFSLGFYAVSAIAALLSAQNKRLGDIAAGTVVVRDRLSESATIGGYLTRTTSADDGLSDTERILVERYVLRRNHLEPRARDRLAGEIAARIRPRLRARFDHLGDDELLEHLGRCASALAFT